MASSSEITRFICLFHSADHAQAAVSALEGLDFIQGQVSTVADGDNRSAQLTDLGVPERDVAHLQEGLQRGGVLVSVRAPEDRSSDIERIFTHYTAGKIDETTLPTANVAAPVAAAAALPVAAAVVSNTGETVIPVAEEELLVGKREVDRGGVRVFRHTVETPVQQDVDLHSERVVVGYREVNRPATDADLRAGSQDIELVETAEVPVVEKRARVVEEVHVGRVESDRTEVVQDSLRHTEVEVEQIDATRPRDLRN